MSLNYVPRLPVQCSHCRIEAASSFNNENYVDIQAASLWVHRTVKSRASSVRNTAAALEFGQS